MTRGTDNPLYYGDEPAPYVAVGMPVNPYADVALDAQADELQLASAMYGAAGEAGAIRGTQLRGQAMMPAMGEAMGGGDALASRRALLGATQAGYGGSVEGVRQSSGDRLAAAEGLMGAQQKRAQIEQQAYQRWLDHWEDLRHAEDVRRGAETARQQASASSSAAARQAAGAALGAAGAGIAAAQDGES